MQRNRVILPFLFAFRTLTAVAGLLLLLLATTDASAQNAEGIIISGTVRDAKGPLPGAMVVYMGGTDFALTDIEGKYQIKIPNINTMMRFSNAGYTPVEKKPDSTRILNIVLIDEVSRLNEVVVVGYGVQKKGDVTGSVAGIKEDEIQQSKPVSFMETMQGRIAGVQVTSTSGEPGAGVTVNVRGTNSFNSGTQPLYVIDGVQIDVNNAEVASSGYGSMAVTNPLTGINPADIASIEVLKDASATAIFGSRGANGVVIVTTKSGKSNTSSLELNMFSGVSWAAKKFNMLGAQDYAAYRFLTGPIDTNWAMDSNGDGTLDTVKDMSNVESHDWQDETLRPAITQSYNVSYSGGNAKTTFFSSVGYLNQQGLVLNNKYERYSLAMKVNHSVSNRLKIGTNVNLSQAIGTGAASSGGEGVRNFNGLVQSFLLTKPVNVPDANLLALDPDGASFTSPVDFVKLAYKKSPITRLLLDVNGNYRILNGLVLDVRGGAVLSYSSNGEFYPSTTSWGLGTNGLAIANRSNSTNWYNTNTLTWNKRLGKSHYVTLLAGFESNYYENDVYSWQGQGFDVQMINPLDNIASAKVFPFPATTTKVSFTRLSEFGRLNYAFKDKYLVTATLRNDASSKLAQGRKSQLFPSGAVAWRASKEGFMKQQRTVTDLKLRGSFGLTGNERIPPYQSLATMANTYYTSAQGGATLGLSPSIAGNPNLTWETTTQYDAGIDLSLWKDRITLTADVYLKQTKDLLIQADLPSQGGYLRQWQNLGQVDNKGLELALSTINVKGRNGGFNWTSSVNMSFNRNKVVSLGSVPFIPVNINGSAIAAVGRVIVGQPIGTGYGYVYDGVYQVNDFDVTDKTGGGTIDPSTVTSANMNNYNYALKSGVPAMQGRTLRPGDMKYKDLNGDGRIDNTNDYQIISNSNPKFYGGFTNTISYKNFELNILFQGSYGNQVINTGRYRYEAGAFFVANITQEYWNDRWTPENATSDVPALAGQGKTDISSYYVEDASYLRLKNVTLSYLLRQTKGMKKVGITSCRFYFTAENLYTWTKYTGFDPEVASYSPLLPGIDNISYPRSRTFIFGINAKF